MLIQSKSKVTNLKAVSQLECEVIWTDSAIFKAHKLREMED